MNKKISILERDFFTLLRAGLWEKAEGELSTNPDWNYLHHMAVSYQVQGVIAEGIAVMGVGEKMPAALCERLMVEEGYMITLNAHADKVQRKLCAILDNNDLPYAIIKGQGVAQSYAKPGIRWCGDIDILVREEDFVRINELFAEFTEEEYHNEDDLHHALHIEDIFVENHAMAKSYFTKRLDRVLEDERRRMFAERDFNHYNSEGYSISIPNHEYTVMFVLGHILRHLSSESCSMKQFCDWVRYIYVNQDKIEKPRLHRMLKEAGICHVWKMFSVFAVEWLGLEPNGVLLYEKGHPEYGETIWRTVKGVRELRREECNMKITNFWLHYLNGYRIFIKKNNYLWNISKTAFAERLWGKFSGVPEVFIKKMFGLDGKGFRTDRFKVGSIN